MMSKQRDKDRNRARRRRTTNPRRAIRRLVAFMRALSTGTWPPNPIAESYYAGG